MGGEGLGLLSWCGAEILLSRSLLGSKGVERAPNGLKKSLPSEVIDILFVLALDLINRVVGILLESASRTMKVMVSVSQPPEDLT